VAEEWGDRRWKPPGWLRSRGGVAGGVDRNLSGHNHEERDAPFTPPTGPNPRRGERRGSNTCVGSEGKGDLKNIERTDWNKQ
jgi:hypothetical protein